MKKLIYILIILAFPLNLMAEDVVLRYWNDTDQMFRFDTTGFHYTAQFQRFDIPGPCLIKAMTIFLTGAPSNVTVCLIGHQGGSPLPQIFAYGGKGLLASGQFQFAGAQQPTKIDLPLQEPISFFGDQCFIGVFIENSANTYFLTNTVELNPSCSSVDGGDFGFQVLANYNATDIAKMWATQKFSYICNLTVEFTNTEPKGYLSDRTVSSGISPNMSFSSVAWGDINNDGYLDLLVAGRLFLNNDMSEFKEITTKAGLSGTPQANAFIDIDNDGDMDILFLNGSSDGKTPSRIYINDGSGNFTGSDLTGLNFVNVTGFSIADLDLDGYPDLFVTQMGPDITNPTALPNIFYLNNKKNGFLIKTGMLTTFSPRRSIGCQFVDFDDDGDLDLYVSNFNMETDELYQNNGNLSFTNIIDKKAIDLFTKDGKTYSNSGTGVDWYDFDNDGDLDLLLPQFTHPYNIAFGFEGTSIYRNSNGSFTDTWDRTELKNSLGIEYEEYNAGGAFGDIDNDGLVDLIMTTYFGCRYIDLYKHNTDHSFSNITYEWGLNRLATGDDACWVDFDNDGKLDLAMSIDRKFKLFKNTFNSGNNWVELDLTSETGNFFAIGARVKLYAGGKIYTQEVTSGRGQSMQKPSRLHFGLNNAASIDKVEIRWPGTKEYITYNDIKINQINKIFNKSVSVEELSQSSEKCFINILGANPANDYLTLEFGLENEMIQPVEISLYDLQGNLIENILNEKYSSGTYKLNINISKYQPGSYFLRFKTTNNSEIKSFVIMR